jgi:hypothetical protein
MLVYLGHSEVTFGPDLSAESFGSHLLLSRKGSSFFCRYILCEMSSRGSYPLHESGKSRSSDAAGWSALVARRANTPADSSPNFGPSRKSSQVMPLPPNCT